MRLCTLSGASKGGTPFSTSTEPEVRPVRKSERLRALLAMGYFPEALPPPFITVQLARYRESVFKTWSSLPHNDYPKTSQEIYSIPTAKRIRRNLSIVNPIAQLHISKLISDNWSAISKHLQQSKYIISMPQFEPERGRAIPLPPFELVHLRRGEISAAFEHALVSDISRFYGTLYTHAIPWALHGKLWCKTNLNKVPYDASLGAKLDKAVRKGQDNQTLGIPVGPDTSRVVAEIVGVAIDCRVQGALKLNSSRGFRHIDDWYIGFDSAGEAEDAIATLATACRDYELELNADKTLTLHASSSVQRVWSTELREHRFSADARRQARSLEHYFIKAFEFATMNPTANVLDYAVKRTRNVEVKRENWRGYETFLLKAARSNATVIPAVVEILVSYNHTGYEIDRIRIAKLVVDLIRRNAPPAHHAEVAWALFLAKALRISIPRNASKAVSQLESSVCGLLALKRPD
jgi:hypothetical protein